MMATNIPSTAKMILMKRSKTRMGWINIAVIVVVGAVFALLAYRSNKNKRNGGK